MGDFLETLGPSLETLGGPSFQPCSMHATEGFPPTLEEGALPLSEGSREQIGLKNREEVCNNPPYNQVEMKVGRRWSGRAQVQKDIGE